MPVIKVKAGHVQPVWAGHPWVYAQAVEFLEGGATAGDEVLVQDAKGNTLGRGLYSPQSAIAVRLYTRDEHTPLDGALISRRIEQAMERRAAVGLPSLGTNAYRLVHAEGDDLPGLVVDRFGDALVVQLSTIGMKRREGVILDVLQRLMAPHAIIDRTPKRTAASEGFEAGSGVVRGDPVTGLSFEEHGLKFEIPLELGQKTGFYLDQRSLRGRLAELAPGRRVLDAFCYVGALSLATARGGASQVRAVDSSAAAIEVAARCAALNQLADPIAFEVGDAFETLKRAAHDGGYDLVIADPPKLAKTRGFARRALSTMRRLAAASLRATAPGGLCVLCSCSAALGFPELIRAAALGGRDARVRPLVLERWSQGPDHPVPAAFPEGQYLSTLILQALPL
ncbi:MAG TPA: class I SAM-dependent rRNA methyltransferase [Polyangiaceae bacterium]|nr:class I SAM-dependent rRNA methyltransferase [Polyangiaceae bacterium]